MRQRPPWAKRLLSRLRLARLGSEWGPWIEKDLEAPAFVFWSAFSNLLLVLIAAGVFALLTGEFPGAGVAGFLAVAWGTLVFPQGRRWIRRRDLEWHRRKWAREPARAGGRLPGV